MRKILIMLALVVVMPTILAGCHPNDEPPAESYVIPAEWAR